MAAIYRDLVDDDARTRQITTDGHDALGRGRNCLPLTQWTGDLDRLAASLRAGQRAAARHAGREHLLLAAHRSSRSRLLRKTDGQGASRTSGYLLSYER
jgi:hypothetical protein